MSEKIRPSFAPLAAKCPGAIKLADDSGTPLEAEEEASTNGTLIHSLLAKYAEGEPPNVHTHGIDDDARILYFAGVRAFDYLSGIYQGDVAIEQFVPSRWCAGGTPDVRFWEEEQQRLVIVDWKSGRNRYDASAQAMTYAMIAAEAMAVQPKEIHLYVVWLRDWEIEPPLVCTMKELEGNKARILASVKKAEGDLDLKDYTTGRHCRWCPAVAVCPAQQKIMVPFARVAMEAMGGKMAESISDEHLVECLDQARVIEKFIKDFREGARARLAERPVALPDGRKLEVKEVERRSVHPIVAWEYLVRRCGVEPNDVVATMSMPMKAFEKLVSEGYARGEKGNAIKTALDDMDTLGGITVTKSKKISEG